MKTFFGKLVAHSNMQTCAKYEIIWKNYALKLAITSVIWLENNESSYYLAWKQWIFILDSSFWEDFFKIFVIFQVCCFVWLLGHKLGCNAKVLHFFNFFWILNAGFKIRSKRRARPVIARGGILQKSWWISD